MVDGKPVTTGTVTNDALTYTQTSETRAWRLIRTYVTDPERATVLIKVRFESKDGEDHNVEIEFDPQLYNDGNDDVGWTRGTRCSPTTATSPARWSPARASRARARATRAATSRRCSSTPTTRCGPAT